MDHETQGNDSEPTKSVQDSRSHLPTSNHGVNGLWQSTTLARDTCSMENNTTNFSVCPLGVSMLRVSTAAMDVIDMTGYVASEFVVVVQGLSDARVRPRCAEVC